MGKSNGGTRAGNAGNPKGLSSGGAISRTENQNGSEMVNRTALALESIAERLYANGDLTVDPGDAVFEEARRLRASQIEESIENSTDYIAQVNSHGEINIQSKFTPEADAIRDYGTERVSIPMENRSLMDIIKELRVSRENSIFNKYR
mgnify:CR=1 FL=1